MRRLTLFGTGLLGLLLCVGCREPVFRTHAYSHCIQNCDPNLVRIELSPVEASLPVGGEQVLVASVVDKEGKFSSGQRVEWIICRSPGGVGEIVLVDESGIFLADRGSKMDNTNAITYTNQFDHTFEKARDGGVDLDTLLGKRGIDELQKGQTWIVISSGVPGETHVMAYAPGIQGPVKSKAFAVVRWKKLGK